MTLDRAEDLTHLQVLVDRYFNHPEAGNYLNVWFHLYERFPNKDGEGIFWTILHGIENYPNSAKLAIESVLRQPSEFPLMMLNRSLNSGIYRVGNVDLLALIQQVATNDRYSQIIRDLAIGYLDRHREQNPI